MKKWESKKDLRKRIDELEEAYVLLWAEKKLGTPIHWGAVATFDPEKKPHTLSEGKRMKLQKILAEI